MTLWWCSVAVSLDGRLAGPGGALDWLDGYPADHPDFLAMVGRADAILMGRTTYDAIRGFGDWPHPGKAAVVLTSRPLDDPPPGVEARGGPLAAAVVEMESRFATVWIEGGGFVLREMMRLGKLDRLDLAVIPVVLGAGPPLFPDGAPRTPLSLLAGRPWVRGAMWLSYAVARA